MCCHLLSLLNQFTMGEREDVMSTIALANYQSPRSTLFDTLHGKANKSGGTCPRSVCQGSVLQPKTEKIGSESTVNLSDVEDFYNQFFSAIEISKSDEEARLKEVYSSIKQNGCYSMNNAELEFACKTAWRNASRCIGRIQWSKIMLLDGRHIRSTKEMFELICQHIENGTNGGNIRSAITVFPCRQSGFNCRIWNSEYISYAGFEISPGVVIGDPNHVEITNICLQLGWKPVVSRFQVLPLLLQFGSANPDMYILPPSLVLEVPLTHPKYPKLGELGLKWFGVPAVCNMSMDCGGLEHPATGFNGWFMSTEVVRDLCDVSRYNLLKEIAESMDMDTSRPALFWKDFAASELNVAVITSFQACNVTITDHHTASETFIHHMETEQMLRGGCPADWVWIIPPLGGSLTPVFHQEMLNYKLKPSYEYQAKPWISFDWEGELRKVNVRVKRLTLRCVARAVIVGNILMKSAIQHRKRCTIIFATETGRSERYAWQLQRRFDQDFNVEIFCMDKYDINRLEDESLLLVITSTFGNGEAPENGKSFEESLIKLAGRKESGLSDMVSQFAVFGLGSSAYPNFCAFSKRLDGLLFDAGLKLFLELHTGDEQKNQEQEFWGWSAKIYSKACKHFGVEVRSTSLELHLFEEDWSCGYKLIACAAPLPPLQGLQKIHNKNISACHAVSVESLVAANAVNDTVLVKLTHEGFSYEPGDHLAVFPRNDERKVEVLCQSVFIEGGLDEDTAVLLANEAGSIHSKHSATDHFLTRIPATSLKTALTHYLDIEVTPGQSDIERLLVVCQCSEEERRKLHAISVNENDYNEWAELKPSWVDLVTEFSSLRIPASFLLAELALLQPRYYSISSSPGRHPDEVHLTVAVLEYYLSTGAKTTQQIKFGLCSTFLQTLSKGFPVYGFVRRCPGFHLPPSVTRDVVMICAGSGLAPFRSFWQHRESLIENISPDAGQLYLFQGFKSRSVLLHCEELDRIVSYGVIKTRFTALSREKHIAKKYVQDTLLEHSDLLYDLLVQKKAHVYVCGDIQMAMGVAKSLQHILCVSDSSPQINVNKHQDAQPDALDLIRQEGRYHEDIYSILVG